MQTLWVLLAEYGFIEQPFKVVKSYRKHERGNRAAVVEVSLGIESFYKVYRATRPGQQSSPETTARWGPSRSHSSKLKALFDEARRYTRLKVPVLILGERDTGKTLLASWLRSHSPFRREALDHRWPLLAACGSSRTTRRPPLPPRATSSCPRAAASGRWSSGSRPPPGFARRPAPMPQLGLLLKGQPVRTANFRQLLACPRGPSPARRRAPSQERALHVALNTPDIALIQGPPGTGKTSVIAALMERLAQTSNEPESISSSVLLTSFQHEAVENAAAPRWCLACPP